jgi:hypothetical protein
MFGKEELAAFLRFGAEELFKPASEAGAAEKITGAPPPHTPATLPTPTPAPQEHWSGAR